MGGYEYIAPSEIRFTQDTIHSLFQDGGSVNQLVEDVDRGRVQVNEIPPIRVCKQNNKYYSIDNRRLYVFRVLQKRNFLYTIKVRLVPYIKEDKFTTENDGLSIRVRRDKTFPHTFDAPAKPKPKSPPVVKPTSPRQQPASVVIKKAQDPLNVNDAFAIDRNIPKLQQPKRLSSRARIYSPAPDDRTQAPSARTYAVNVAPNFGIGNPTYHEMPRPNPMAQQIPRASDTIVVPPVMTTAAPARQASQHHNQLLNDSEYDDDDEDCGPMCCCCCNICPVM